ncbi:hypothetical protein SLA2020_378600 [Shorea laevis]
MHCLAISLNYLHCLAFHSGTYILYQFLFSLQSLDQPLLEIHPSIPPVPHPHPFKNMNYFPLFVMILLVISETPLSSSNSDLYRTCSNQFKCGKVSAGFSFWGEGQRPRECGHPGLQLQCKNNETAILEIVGVRYRVLEIPQHGKRLKIAREDYEGGICPQNIQHIPNTNLDASPFVSAPDYKTIILLYGCTTFIPLWSSLGNFSCSLKGFNSSKGYIHPGVLPGPVGCSANATVLVHESFFFLPPQIITQEIVEQALKDGFEVEWKVDDEWRCSKCIKSKGYCGIDPANKTVCYCQEPNSSEPECLPLPPAPSPSARLPSNADKRGKYLMSRYYYRIE